MPPAKQSQKPTKSEIAARVLEAGVRARLEAETRRARAAQEQSALPKEVGGQKGPEPTRYGDWEKKGITSDF